MISLPKHAVIGLIAVLVGGSGLTPVFAADAVPRAELLASMCATCHGSNGKGAKPSIGAGFESRQINLKNQLQRKVEAGR